jgi:hypothetical protein
MSTTTQARTTKSNAKATARSASKTATSASATARRETRRTERGVTAHTRRVLGAAQAELSAVASQPTRPLLFTLGVVDRATAGVRALPGTVGGSVVTAPSRTRERLVDVFATAGDLAERAQRGYTEVTKDGEKLVRSVRRQESTQQAVKYVDRAQTRAARSVQDAEKALEAGSEAAAEAVSKLG